MSFTSGMVEQQPEALTFVAVEQQDIFPTFGSGTSEQQPALGASGSGVGAPRIVHRLILVLADAQAALILSSLLSSLAEQHPDEGGTPISFGRPFPLSIPQPTFMGLPTTGPQQALLQSDSSLGVSLLIVEVQQPS